MGPSERLKQDVAIELTTRELHKSTEYADQEKFSDSALVTVEQHLDVIGQFAQDFPSLLSIVALIRNRRDFECDQRAIENQTKQEPHE